MGAPALHDRVEAAEQSVERLVRADLPTQHLDLRHDGGQCLLGGVGVDVIPVGPPLAVALDAPPEESRPSSMWVINVFSSDRRRPIVVSALAISSRSSTASAWTPCTARHQSS